MSLGELQTLAVSRNILITKKASTGKDVNKTKKELKDELSKK
jgi:hypothetical protein